MKEQFATYEIALKLKELGFDEKCIGYFNNKELNYGFSGKAGYTYKVFTWKAKKEVILAPLWQQVIDWLEKEYDILFGFLPKIGSKYSHWGQECSEIHTYIHGSLVYSPKYRCYDIFFWKDGKFNGSAHGYGNLYNCREYAIIKTLEELCKEKNSSQH